MRQPSPLNVRGVVVTWQAAHLLPECLDSLRGQIVADAELEIVVVDNASTDGTLELLARDYPEIRVINSPSNLGFAGGVALGTGDFDGDVVVLLNNDAVFEPGAVAHLVDGLRTPGSEAVAAVTAKIVLAGTYKRDALGAAGAPDARAGWAPTTPDDPAGVILVNSTGNIVHPNGSGTDRDWLAVDGAESREPVVFGFCGGAAALRWSAVQAVGGFDAELFLYYEDTDLSWRLRAHGWDVRYAADAVAHHRHAASTGTASPVFRYYNTRNSLIVVTRHAPWPMVVRSYTRQCAGWLKANLRPGGSTAEVHARGRALRDAFRRLPRSLRERHELWGTATMSRHSVLRAP